MTSYSNLVNIEVGNATNYGCHFKLSRLHGLEAIKALKKSIGKRRRIQLMRVYIAGSMESGNTHLGHFASGNNII